MVQKQYDWPAARLEEHSRRKLKILSEYVFDYLKVRCRNAIAFGGADDFWAHTRRRSAEIHLVQH